ncbi:Hypothetical predicted protein [Paramuricea clavata]|uniref:Uncharacterized protein n=1 Tax=Paramuricea clavata TaxID=317549 RepID=A0A7D9H9J8_PARCT|nr:Hypothetical predicted protein [Paramuricea clavata]
MSGSESDPDLALERYDLEDVLNAYGSPVCISQREELTGVEAAAIEPLNEPPLAADDDRTQVSLPYFHQLFHGVAAKISVASEAAERSEVAHAEMKVPNGQKDVHVELKRLIAKTSHSNREQLPPQMQDKTHLDVTRSQSTKQKNRLR